MSEPMTTYVEIWPVAADDAGIWLLSGTDAWRPRLPVMADSDPHWEVEQELSTHGVRSETRLMHSTSWRVDGPSILLTYIAEIECPGLVLDHWRDATPISLELAQAVGQPPAATPTAAPEPRYIDVLIHALRHLRFLMETDDINRNAMSGQLRQHLLPLTPALATMYRTTAPTL